MYCDRGPRCWKSEDRSRTNEPLDLGGKAAIYDTVTQSALQLDQTILQTAEHVHTHKHRCTYHENTSSASAMQRERADCHHKAFELDLHRAK